MSQTQPPTATDQPPRRSMLWRGFQGFCRIVTTVLFDLKVYNRGNVPRRGPVLFAANHQSYLDPVLVAVQLRRPVSFLAKSELFENPVFGWLIRSLHAFPVRQGEGDIGAIKEAIRRLKEGNILTVYPEGSRTEDGELGPIQQGIALIIRRAAVPVVPIAIEGSFAAWPRHRKLFHGHPIKVIYGQPMRLDGMKPAEIAAKLDAALRGLIAQLRRDM